MKRVHPLVLVIGVVVLFAAALIWKIRSADECMDRNGVGSRL
jgi:hypothetical protein